MRMPEVCKSENQVYLIYPNMYKISDRGSSVTNSCKTERTFSLSTTECATATGL